MKDYNKLIQQEVKKEVSRIKREQQSKVEEEKAKYLSQRMDLDRERLEWNKLVQSKQEDLEQMKSYLEDKGYKLSDKWDEIKTSLESKGESLSEREIKIKSGEQERNQTISEMERERQLLDGQRQGLEQREKELEGKTEGFAQTQERINSMETDLAERDKVMKEKESKAKVKLEAINIKLSEGYKEWDMSEDKIHRAKKAMDRIQKDWENRETLLGHNEKLAESRFQAAYNKELRIKDKVKELNQLKAEVERGQEKIDVSAFTS